MKPPTARPEVFTGLCGRVVDLFDPHTEADPADVASRFLVAFWNAAGRGPTIRIGATPHQLIHAVRDRMERTTAKDETVVADEGVNDKRLLVLESELRGALKAFQWEGNILSNVIRDAWEGKTIVRTITKSTPTRATGAHSSIIGHSTQEHVAAYLATWKRRTAWVTGF